MSSVFLENLSWLEAEAAHARLRTAMIPIGARAKEHGPHLPLNNDYVLAEELAKRVAARASVIVYPTIPYGNYPAFIEYPGSVSLSEEVFQGVLVDIARSIASHGARRIYFLNTGISTCWALEPARQQLARDGLLMEYTDLRVDGSKAKNQVRTQERGTHADEIETSMMLHLAPAIVRMELARKETSEHGPGPLTRVAGQPGTYSPSGIWGDATLATEEKGRIIVEGIVGDIVSFLARFESDDYSPLPARTQYLRP